VDLRFLEWDDRYSSFVKDTVAKLTAIDARNNYTIYLREWTEFKTPLWNETIIYSNIVPGSLEDQITFHKILSKANYNLVLFFDFWKPIRYTKQYFVFIPSLKEVFYQSFDSALAKWKYMTMIGHSIKHANKILVFDDISKRELSERFNIAEERIFLNSGAFQAIQRLDDIELDLGVTWWIKNPYLIYPGGWGIEKNLERMAEVMGRIKKSGINMDLVILWDEASGNIALRDKIIEHELQQNIFFVGTVEPRQQQLLYKQSKWVIYPSLYETFLFDLTLPLHLNIPILAGNIPIIKKVLWNSVSYFSPISSRDMYEKTKQFIDTKHEANYSSIIGKYSSENSAKQLLETILL